jgi:Ribbon-helix-helix protein, copG family
MRRTQVYITEEQDERIAARAVDTGVSKAEVIRRALDRGLGVDDGRGERRRAIEATAGIASDEEEWPQWLARVRGGSAAERLERLGT